MTALARARQRRRLVAIATVLLADQAAVTVPLPRGRHRRHPRTRPLEIGEREW